MVSIDIGVIIDVLAAIGGTSGIILGINYIRNKFLKLKILSSRGEWKTIQGDLIVKLKLQLFNKKDYPVYITDIVGFLIADQNKNNQRKIHDKRPWKFSSTKIEGRGTAELEIELNFSDVDIDSLERIGYAHFTGFTKDGVPVAVAENPQSEEERKKLPLRLNIALHINGNKTIENVVPVSGSDKSRYGTLSLIEIERLKRGM